MFDTAKILVVDDDPHVRETIRMALHDAGMDVSVAGNGSEGLAHFIVRPSDLIVLDVGMPGMDGLEMCRRIRRSSNVPILFLSRAMRKSTAFSVSRSAATITWSSRSARANSSPGSRRS
jgi:DNA-binding response OmpR family regulator